MIDGFYYFHYLTEISFQRYSFLFIYLSGFNCFINLFKNFFIFYRMKKNCAQNFEASISTYSLSQKLLRSSCDWKAIATSLRYIYN